MYKPKAIPAIRLPKIFELPTAEDVGRCVGSAQKMRGRVAELPWQSAEQTGDMVGVDCVLACTWMKDADEPTFSFYRGDSGDRQLRWRHQTRDMGLISILCQRECLGTEADVSASDRLGSTSKKEESASEGTGPVEPAGMPAAAAAGPEMGGFQPIQPMVGMAPIGGLAPMAGGFQPMMAPMGGLAAPVAEQSFGSAPAPAPVAPTEPNRGFAEVEKAPTRTATMQGDLQRIKATNLLQTMSMGKMNGLLEIIHNESIIEIYVEDGNPVHATSDDCKGEAAVLEMLTWEQGKFKLFADQKTSDRTVLKRLDNILMESAPLVDQYRFLNQTGVTMDSFLIRKHATISEPEFEQRISRGAQTDLQKQKLFYQALDSQSNLFEILRKMPLSKSEWVPCVYNLVVCDLVTVAAVAPQAAKAPPIESTGVERASVQAAMQGLYRADTGLLAYPVILNYLEQEFFRYEYTAAPFSVLIFEMCKRTPQGIESLSPGAVREAAKRIDTVKRNVDCLAHFEGNSFMLFLPFTRVQAANFVARRITEVLWDKNLGGELDSSALALAFGVAGIPEDCQDLGMLLAAGKQAVTSSKQTGSPVVTFQSLNR
ncbi:MAG: DUF4388 domain-containing protein [Cyanobacteria bacterium SZAS LIN-2]|nr:DUF4388 domain-containing protein [Cyanobacteria bacterium SZAS LIN-2]